MEDRTVLIVDDEDGIRNSLKRTLRNEPYQRLYASNVEEAKKLINENAIHLIISDLLMPGTDGLSLLEWVKNHNPEIVRMVLSMKSDSKTILDAVNKGNIFYYISKPWDNTELKVLIKKGLDWYNLQAEKKRLMNELKEHNLTLEQRVNDRTNQLLAITNEAEIGKHTSQIVHNLNNALNNILGSIELCGSALYQEEIDTDKLQTYHQLLKKSTDSLSRIVSEILIRARRNDKPQHEKINLNKLIKDEILFWEMNHEFKYKISKDIQLNECTPCIQGNQIQIKQILDNIIKNAIDAMEKSKEKKLSIETGVENGFVFMQFRDTGEGIPEDNLLKIFSPGFTTKPIGKGTGLGLASTKTMVESYSGKIEVQSQKHKGTTITIYLPEDSVMTLTYSENTSGT